MKVSIMLLTHNEETNIGRCLDSLAWCDDIWAMDSGSTDSTLEIMKARGVRVLHRPFDDFARQRNFGLENCDFRHDWILHLDADEESTPEFAATLAALAPQTGIDAYHVPSKLMLFGGWLRRAGMYPGYQVRLGERTNLRFVQVGHGQREDLPAERVGVFPEPYLHHNFSHGLVRWFEKHIRYARDEAALILASRTSDASGGGGGGGATSARRKAKQLAARLPLFLRPVARFCYVYLFRMGFRDGLPGLCYATMLSVYEGMTAVFVYEARLRGRGHDKP